MNRYTCFVAGLFATLVIGPAIAADIPKEGTFKGSFSSYETYKVVKVGDRTFTVFDDTGPQLTDGFGDHVAQHCWGIGETVSGSHTNQGYCVGTDATGDQYVQKFAGQRSAQEKVIKGTGSLVSGTGKFAGISGSVQYVARGSEFHPIGDGASVGYVTFEGSYKLP